MTEHAPVGLASTLVGSDASNRRIFRITKTSLSHGPKVDSLGAVGSSSRRGVCSTTRRNDLLDFLNHGARFRVDQHHALAGMDVAVFGERRTPLGRHRLEFDVARHR